CTTRGFKEKDFVLVGHLIADILDGLKNNEDSSKAEQKILSEVTKLIKLFPFYE
ncbi:MAG TPA: serine hydroxymethyltransferase, partial [Rickettsia endosymbiont of Omalisus fontisbellaquei]|nr:serine hydroxymethyltransferase [Rickettsia endosymbiont of Omalisus fontisbellaquei]